MHGDAGQQRVLAGDFGDGFVLFGADHVEQPANSADIAAGTVIVTVELIERLRPEQCDHDAHRRLIVQKRDHKIF